MKVDFATSFVGACLLLACSIMLHGCQWAEDLKDLDKLGKESSATCDGKKFDCNGARNWCAKMEKKCKSKGGSKCALGQGGTPKNCNPECTWECEAQKCHKTCSPKCQAPVCATRCKREKPNGCKMECGKRECSVVCPKDYCPREGCPKCETVCGKPQCKMTCPTEPLACRHVCADPVCKWECQKPKECPKPRCHMKCEDKRKCPEKETVSKLPPLEEGEIEVADKEAPASFVQVSTSAGAVATLRVNMTSVGQDLALRWSQVDLSVTQDDDDCEGATTATWTSKMRSPDGQMQEESEASCTGGNFQCQGDTAWCTQQQEILCKGAQSAEPAFLQQRLRAQGHLHA